MSARTNWAAAAAVVTLTLLAVLAGVTHDGGHDSARGPGPDRGGAGPSRPPAAVGTPASETASSTASPRPPRPTDTTAADGSDTGACFDGTCEVAVSKPTVIDVDSRAVDGGSGTMTISVAEITSGYVTFETAAADGTLVSESPGPGESAGFNDLTIRVKAIAGRKAVLRFSHGK